MNPVNSQAEQAHTNPLCDCRKRASQARIRSLDGLEIARGQLKLADDGKSGWFEPDSASLIRRALGGSTYPKLLADLGTHQHTLLNASHHVDKEGRPLEWTPGPFGEVVGNQRFYFDCD